MSTSAVYVRQKSFNHRISHLCHFFLGLSNGAIRSIRLVVEPNGVRRLQSATLRCLYDLDGAPLLSLQFYRGSGEFYRYSPTQSPTKKVFPLSGINVDVSIQSVITQCSQLRHLNTSGAKKNVKA